jgi:hypothetical protein
MAAAVVVLGQAHFPNRDNFKLRRSSANDANPVLCENSAELGLPDI